MPLPGHTRLTHRLTDRPRCWPCTLRAVQPLHPDRAAQVHVPQWQRAGPGPRRLAPSHRVLPLSECAGAHARRVPDMPGRVPVPAWCATAAALAALQPWLPAASKLVWPLPSHPPQQPGRPEGAAVQLRTPDCTVPPHACVSIPTLFHLPSPLPTTAPHAPFWCHTPCLPPLASAAATQPVVCCACSSFSAQLLPASVR